MGGGAPTVTPQAPSQQELDLRQAQADLARQQQSIAQEQLRQQNLLQPILMQNQGYLPTYGGADAAATSRAQAIDARLAALQSLQTNTPQYIQTQTGFAQGGPQYQGGDNGANTGFGANPITGNGGMGGATFGQTLNPAYNPSGWQNEMTALRSERAGLAGQLDPQRITGWSLSPEAAAHQDALKQLSAQQDTITSMMQDRTLKALRGELPVDPALERELQQGRLTLGDTLQRNLGTGWETSTPGSQAMSDYDKRAEELRYASRRDQLYQGQQLDLANQQYSQGLNQMQFQNVTGLEGQNAGVIAALGGAGQTFGQAVNPYLQDRQFALQAGMTNAQSQSAANQGTGALIGSGIGAVATYAGLAAF